MELTKIIAKYVGKDGWSRPVFKTEARTYYCLLDLPGSFEELEAMVDEAKTTFGLIYYKGSNPDGEPSWPVDNVTLVLENLGE